MGCEPRGDSVKEVLGGAREPHQASLAFERVQGALVGFPAQPRVSPRFLESHPAAGSSLVGCGSPSRDSFGIIAAATRRS